MLVSVGQEDIGPLPNDIGERYNTRLLTPRDWGSHFKNVLHRALLVRSISSGEPCRCCGYAYENLQHFAKCEAAGLNKVLRLAFDCNEALVHSFTSGLRN